MKDCFRPAASVRSGWNFSADHRIQRCCLTTIASIWSSIRSPIREDHDLRGALDGRAGDYLSRQDLCGPSFAEPFVERGPDGDGGAGHAKLRQVGRATGRGPAAAGEMAKYVTAAGSPLAFVRRIAFCGELDEG